MRLLQSLLGHELKVILLAEAPNLNLHWLERKRLLLLIGAFLIVVVYKHAHMCRWIHICSRIFYQERARLWAVLLLLPRCSCSCSFLIANPCASFFWTGNPTDMDRLLLTHQYARRFQCEDKNGALMRVQTHNSPNQLHQQVYFIDIPFEECEAVMDW